MLEIKKKSGIEEIEFLHKELSKIPPGTKINIKIPLKLEAIDFGVLPALTQFIATWIRTAKNGDLVVPFSDIEKEGREFVEDEFIYPLLIMNWKNSVIDEKTGTDIRPVLKNWTTEMNYKMRSLKTIKGNQLLLTCFDHVPAKTGLLDCFYTDYVFLTKEDALDFTLIPSIIQVLTMSRAVFKKEVRPLMDDIRGIIYELMKNTDEWARTDRNNRPFNPNVRGLYIKFTRRGKKNLINNYSRHEGYKNFFNDLVPNENDEIYFMELSVFDSGAGFLERRKESHIDETMNDKVNYLKQCLVRHSTSSTGVSAVGKGLGLDRILRILNKKGFLMIRTNELFVYRNLKLNEYQQTENASDITLFDWATHTSTQYTALPSVVGAGLTIIYPLS